MPYSSRSYVNRYIPSNRFPVGLKWLLIANVSIFVFAFILRGSLDTYLIRTFALIPAEVTHPPFAAWRLFTYMFLHGSSIGLILWNMLALWMFGAPLERLWGTPRFLRFYFGCGIISAIAVILFTSIFRGTDTVTVGSSAAVNAILVAYGLMFPDNTVLFGFLIPMKSKYMVMIIAAIVFLQSYLAASGGQGSGIAIATLLLTGLAAGFLWLRGRRLQTQIREPLAAGYKEWKLRRAKRKFEVYLKKQDSNRDRWVH
ncbi:MAG: rhomboid family intramembrane serine protease [Acidobacteriaceae bacterium]|nr:rhomboid family intramembrane serine protease [Acidobacteriaceae bacterium]